MMSWWCRLTTSSGPGMGRALLPSTSGLLGQLAPRVLHEAAGPQQLQHEVREGLGLERRAAGQVANGPRLQVHLQLVASLGAVHRLPALQER
jgi:hypothetical protein